MTRIATISLAAALGLCVAAPAAHAHHSYATFFDLCSRVTIEVRVDGIEWKSPHIWLAVRTDDGTKYRVEWTGPQNLEAEGIASDALKPGDRLVIIGSPPKRRWENVVSALTEIRRPSDNWSWSRTAPPPTECGQR